MGGTDLFDMLMALYRVEHRSTKWYMRIFLWALHTAAINSWNLYRQSHPETSLSDFIATLAQELIYHGKVLFVRIL
jgi:hypothetical protein